MITATRFLEQFNKFVHESKAQFTPDSWKDSSGWLNALIGPASAAVDKSPLGKHLKDNLDPNLRSRTEEWKIDLVLSAHENALRYDIQTGDPERLLAFQPVLYDILIEHENSIGLSYQEMLKLVYMRARLKVLITYTFDSDGSDEQEQRALDAIIHARKQFDRMVNDSNANYPENPATEYVFIVGWLISGSEDPKARINWAMFRRNARGKFESVQFPKS